MREIRMPLFTASKWVW